MNAFVGKAAKAIHGYAAPCRRQLHPSSLRAAQARGRTSRPRLARRERHLGWIGAPTACSLALDSSVFSGNNRQRRLGDDLRDQAVAGVSCHYLCVMRAEDFFIDDISDDPWGSPSNIIDDDLVSRVHAGSVQEAPDTEVAVALARLVHEEYEERATSDQPRLTDAGSRATLAALRSVLNRLGIQFKPPFTDFTSFSRYWRLEGMTGNGSWAERRRYLAGLFNPVHEALADLEAGAPTNALAAPATSHPRTGWTRVDEEIAELRRHFQASRTPQDYRNVGNDCVVVIERVSEVAYEPSRHLPVGEEQPPVSNTKARLERVVEVELPGAGNAELRKLARAAIEQAQAVKHRSPDRRHAGVAADSVILLANIFRRITSP